jgi:hypothetical protein
VPAAEAGLDVEQQPVELPLEHVGPEPKDWAQLCVAEASKIDKKPTSARSTNYQQSKRILASSGSGFSKIGVRGDPVLT